MISYELAKQLKEAGFLQRESPNILTQGHYLNESGKTLYSSEEEGDVYIPTLSELIEACIKDHKCPNFNLNCLFNDYNLEWFASLGKDEGYGFTPIQAVANLWLALNRKE